MENFGKMTFFREDMAGLGKYHTGGYGQIGVYRVNCLLFVLQSTFKFFRAEGFQSHQLVKLYSYT